MRATSFQKGRDVPADSLIDAHGQCPICLNENPRRPVFALPEHPSVSLLLCENCMGCSASHMPDTKILDQYYQGYYDHHDQGMTFYKPQRLAKHIYKMTGKTSFLSVVSILDFGGGDGSLAVGIAKCLLENRRCESVRICVVDFADEQISVPDRVFLSRFKNLDDVNGQFDFVLASAVLEHIPQLNPVILKLFSFVNPGGFFYARTPYVLPLTRIFKNMDITFPGHVHDLGAPFWNHVISTFNPTATLLSSRPSMVESGLDKAPARTIAAYLMKFPAHVELFFAPRHIRDVRWNFVGGWEVLLQFVGD